MSTATATATRRQEMLIFFILMAVVFPLLVVAFVGGWGFVVWMYQIIAGPPGPPPVH